MLKKNGTQKRSASKAQRKSKHRFNIAISERERWALMFFSHAPPVRQKPPREVRQTNAIKTAGSQSTQLADYFLL